MSDEFDPKESNVWVEKVEKVELHFHFSLAPVPAWATGGPNAAGFYGEPPRKSGWVAKTFGVVALVSVVAVGLSFVYRDRDNRPEMASAASMARVHTYEPIDPDKFLVQRSDARAPVRVGPDNDAVLRQVEGTGTPMTEAPHVAEEVPRRGSGAFGLR